MDLKTYLSTLTKEERTRFIRLADIKPSYLPQLSGGHSKPSLELAIRMQEASGGAVTVRELLPDRYEKLRAWLCQECQDRRRTPERRQPPCGGRRDSDKRGAA